MTKLLRDSINDNFLRDKNFGYLYNKFNDSGSGEILNWEQPIDWDDKDSSYFDRVGMLKFLSEGCPNLLRSWRYLYNNIFSEYYLGLDSLNGSYDTNIATNLTSNPNFNQLNTMAISTNSKIRSRKNLSTKDLDLLLGNYGQLFSEKGDFPHELSFIFLVFIRLLGALLTVLLLISLSGK